MQAAAIFDRELIERYDRQGPRYTSYPTAAQFNENFDEHSYLEAVAHSNGDLIPAPLSLYVHIPFCATVCYYCACNKVVTKNRERAREYLQRLLREVRRQGALFDPGRQVLQIHWGGGTPTYLSRDQMEELMRVTMDNFNVDVANQPEIAIEIDPRTVSSDDVRFLSDLGFNRISFGVQDLDPEVQLAVNRIQSADQTVAVINAARDVRFESVSIDLIYGLPKQSVESFDRTLNLVIAARPDRISVFNYAHLPSLFKVQRQINVADLPSADVKLRMLARTIDRLLDAGYVYIGMDHFALPHDELALAQKNGTLTRNFQGYSTRANCDIVGLGVSSISRIGNCYSQNERELDRYQQRIDEGGLAIMRGLELSGDDRLRREIIMRLICHFELDFSSVESAYGIKFESYFADTMTRLAEMQADELITVSEGSIEVLPKGRLLIRNICMVFDRYLNRAESAAAVYSRVL